MPVGLHPSSKITITVNDLMCTGINVVLGAPLYAPVQQTPCTKIALKYQEIAKKSKIIQFIQSASCSMPRILASRLGCKKLYTVKKTKTTFCFKNQCASGWHVNPVNPKIQIQILQTDFHTFLLRIVERIWFNIKVFFLWSSIY